MGNQCGGRIEYVRIFSIVALFILLIACINFMNLSTARSSERAKEVGVRKVVGALRSSLVGQFMSESLIMSLLAVRTGPRVRLGVVTHLQQVFEKQLTLSAAEPSLWLSILGLVLITGILSGSYPAFFLSSLQPIKILKGNGASSRLQFGPGPALFRRVLVVFQFSLSIFLIVGMLAVGRQMNYLRTKNLGLDRENVVYIPLEGEIAQPKKVDAFRQEVMRKPTVASATTTMSLPVNVQSTSGDLKWAGKDPKQETSVACMFVGGDFMQTMNIKLARRSRFSG